MALSGALEIGRGKISIVADATKFEAAMGRVEKRLHAVGGTLKLFAGAAATALALGKTSLMISGLIDNAIDLESQFSKVRKTTGLTGDELTKFRAKVEGIAQSMSGVKLEDLLDISVMGGRLGIASDKIERYTRDIAMVAIALDDIPAEEAATSIGRILNVFNLGTDSAIRFASALNKLDDTSTATGRDILDISRRLSGPAAVLGMSPQKVLALSAALKDAGVNNEVAGTAMSQVFAHLAVDSAKFAAVAGIAGPAFKRMVSRDPLVALQAFLAGLKRLRGEAQYEVLAGLGLKGARVQTALLQLSRVTDKLNGYVHTANKEWDSLASVMREVDIQGQTTKAQLLRMWNAVTILSAKIGEAALPLVKALANSFTDLAIGAQAFWEANKADIAQRLAPAVKWAERLSVLFKEWPRFTRLAWLELTEKFEQLAEVGDRFTKAMWVDFAIAGANALTFIKNAFTQFALFLGDLFTQVSANFSFHIRNALDTALHGFAEKNKNLIKVLFPGLGLLDAVLPKGGGGGGVAPAIQPKVDMFDQKKLGNGMIDFVNPLAGLFNALPNKAFDKFMVNKAIDRAVGNANADRAARAAANMPNPDEGKPGPKKTAKQRLNEANMAEARKRHGFGDAAPDAFVRQQLGFMGEAAPVFRGTEAQAQRILDARARDAARKNAAKRNRALQNPADRMGLFGAGLINDADLMFGGPKKGKAGKAQKVNGRRLGGFWEQFDEMMGVGGEGGFAAAQGKNKTKSEFMGLEDFAKMTQTGALNQEDYQKKMLAGSDKQVKALQNIERILENGEDGDGAVA